MSYHNNSFYHTMTKSAHKHHFISQFYLSGFAFSEKKDDYLWVLDLKKIKKGGNPKLNLLGMKKIYTQLNYKELNLMQLKKSLVRLRIKLQ